MDKDTPSNMEFEDEFEAMVNTTNEPPSSEDIYEEDVEEETPEESEDESPSDEGMPSQPIEEEEDIDYRTLYQQAKEERDREFQRFRSLEGRFKKFREEAKTEESAVIKDHADFWSDYEVMKQPIIDLMKQLMDERFGDVTTVVEEVKGEVNTIKQNTHLSRISSAHPDYMEVAQSNTFKAWVNSLPGNTSKGWSYKEASRVIEEGTADEVVKLLSSYKEFMASSKPEAPVKKPTPKERLADKVVKNLAVDSDFSQPKITKGDGKKSFEEDFESFL